MTKKPKVEAFKQALDEVADKLGLEPEAVSKTQFFAEQELVSEWEVRKLGGYAPLKKMVYPSQDLTNTNAFGVKYVNSFINKVARKHNVDEYLKNEFLAQFKETLKTADLKVHRNSKPLPKKRPKTRSIVAHVSDTHFGANIEASEMHNINEFNWTIASRRMALFAEQIVNYKPQHRAETELVICVNGDIIAGVIHDQEWFSDLLTKQVAGAMKILIQFITYCAKYFSNVRVVFTTGNHGRAMHKSNKSRATTHKWDSYETCIYVAVKHAVELSCKNVTCEIPLTPYAIVNIQGHLFLQTHGDTVLNVGNPGRSINMKSINMQINSINSSALAPVKLAGILVGHVHVNTVQITDNGTVLIINGPLSGADPFCQSIGIFGNEPSQTLFEVTKEYSVGDVRFLRLASGDKRADLDKIIEPLKDKLE